MKRASKLTFPFAIIVLLVFQMANAAVTYEEGQNRLLFGDIDAAIEIFDNLALLGDTRAANAAEQLRALSIEEREQYLSQIAAGALKSGNLDEAERLYSLLRDQAAERGDRESVGIYAQVLTLVADAKETAAAETSLATMRCETTVSIQSGSIGTDAAESCPANAPEPLIEKHRGEVAAAWQALRESGATDGSVLVITEDQSH
jgi:hypothetical protein